MGKLFNEIKNDLKDAILKKREVELRTLRMLIASLKNKEIELKEKEGLKDDIVTGVVKSEMKKRKDSIDAYTKGNRQDLVEVETKEVEVLKKYMPKELSEEEIGKVVLEVISGIGEVSMSDFGKVMGAVMSKLKNQADGNTVNKIVKQALSK